MEGNVVVASKNVFRQEHLAQRSMASNVVQTAQNGTFVRNLQTRHFIVASLKPKTCNQCVYQHDVKPFRWEVKNPKSSIKSRCEMVLLFCSTIILNIKQYPPISSWLTNLVQSIIKNYVLTKNAICFFCLVFKFWKVCFLIVIARVDHRFIFQVFVQNASVSGMNR